jgi:hypothetical protein
MLDLVAVRDGGTVADALAIALRTAQHAESLGLHRCILLTGLRQGRLFALNDFTHWVSVPKPRQAPSVRGFSGFYLG